MKKILQSNKKLLLLMLVATAALIVWLSPSEKTLGSGIKIVYIHVTFIWTGILGFTISAGIATASLFIQKNLLNGISRTISLISYAWFLAGYITSILAAKINWGAVYWQEPRMLAFTKFILVTTAILYLGKLISNQKLKAAAIIFIGIMMWWLLLETTLILHPENPIHTASSSAIQMTFYLLFLVNLTAAAWSTGILHTKNQYKS